MDSSGKFTSHKAADAIEKQVSNASGVVDQGGEAIARGHTGAFKSSGTDAFPGTLEKPGHMQMPAARAGVCQDTGSAKS